MAKRCTKHLPRVENTNGSCKSCAAEAVKRYRLNNPEKRKESRKRWKINNPEKVAQIAEAYKDTQRDKNLERLYGFSTVEFDLMYQAQSGKCAICHNELKLHVDHNHQSGQIRGLLCQCCNRGLGLFKDNPAILRLAAGYLEKE